MNAKKFDGINYPFHPKSHWEVSDPSAAILLNVMGTNRRQMIRDYMEAGKIDELKQSFLLDSLDNIF